MKAVTERLEKWLEANIPETLEDLAPGCSDAAIAEFESLVGKPFPESLKALYKWRDGQRGAANSGPFYGLEFLSLAKARDNWESWKSIIDGWSSEEMTEASAFCTSGTPDAVQKLYASKYWIPFAYDYGGNHLGVDLDPGARGTVGQVINFGSDEDDKYVVATSVAAFMEWLVDQLESGNFMIEEEDDGSRSLNTRTPEMFHFLDAVPVLFGAQSA
ncbi:SMI1/KNR4 family protein [Pseudomonas sp. RIT778]|uniref:SMI1/KNR4 family protein n=1 Tax=Pseudomonas sp. RIT778 TaxID=2870471 RepID=UPI001C873AA0|nr:SMI1/KNR4 family protein [Pseudomonas sp. RIT778]MBX8471872.1 SMI1/KNR4 family protein [Pseudomonas sp. RIT778]